MQFLIFKLKNINFLDHIWFGLKVFSNVLGKADRKVGGVLKHSRINTTPKLRSVQIKITTGFFSFWGGEVCRAGK